MLAFTVVPRLCVSLSRPSFLSPRHLRRRPHSSFPHLRPSRLPSAMTTTPTPPLTELYPPLEATSSGHLKVSPLHTIFYEEAGNPASDLVALFVHGGPGGGIEPKCRRFFDPSTYRIILFDQRGCGKSTPLGCTEENTTADLIADIEALRASLSIPSWLLFGGSWGSTLSLAYAQAHPDRVRGLVLRGIFALRRREIDWLYERGGAEMLAPDAWADYVAGLPEGMREAPRLLDAFHDVFNGDDEAAKKKAALAWSGWEGATSYFVRPEAPIKFDEPDFAAVFARIECHYFKNAGFFPDGSLLDSQNIDLIRTIPTTLVQGRWDLVCPIKTAYELKKVFPEATLKVVQNAGHSAFEPGTISELVRATDSFRDTALG